MIAEAQTRSSTLSRVHPGHAMLAAVQFLTRIPTPDIPYTESTLPAALAYFPLVGALIGAFAASANYIFATHLSRLLAAIFTVTLTVAITGALHEDGLADCADAFGSSHSRERTLAILRDSRIGTYGTVALVLSLSARILLISELPLDRVFPYLVAAHTLARWSSLPLSHLPPAREDEGQGARVAQRTPVSSLLLGTVIAFGILFFSLRGHALSPALVTLLVTAACAAYFRQRLQGVTGDCFGATTQLVEITVLICGAWSA